MYSGDQVVVVIDEAEVCAARMAPSAAGSGAVRRPLSVITDGVGDPVPVGTPGAPRPAVDGLLSRVGDPVPVRVGTRTWPAETLVALVIADAAAAVADESAGPLVLVLPDEWRAHRRELLRGAVTQLTEQPVTVLSAALGLVDFDVADDPAGPVLVLEAGNESIRAHLFTHGDGGRQGSRTSRADWGGNDIDDALVDFVGDRSPSGRGTGAQDADAVRAACASARADLARRTATEVELPGRDPVRLVRADLELLVGGTVADVVGQVVADALDPHGEDRPSRVLVTGPLATLPMVVEAVSAAVGTSVEHVTDEQALQRYSSAAVLALESTAVADGVDTDEHEDDTRALPLAPLRPVRRQGRHHRTAILVAASLAVAAPVAAMTMTDAGEATLLSMVDGIVPQESSDDTASDDVLGRLTDAARLPALPWGNEDEADGPVTPIGTGGGPTGEAGTQGPATTSTRGAGKDEDSTNEKKDGKDKGSDKDDKKEKKDGKDKGKAKTKGKSSDKGSPNSSSSSNGRTPNKNSTSSAGGPSTPDDTTSSAPDTPDPTTSTPDPTTPTPDPTTTTPTPDPTTTTPDPTTTTSAPDPTTTAAEPGPSTTSTASTTSGTTTVAAPVTSETTIAAELGTP